MILIVTLLQIGSPPEIDPAEMLLVEGVRPDAFPLPGGMDEQTVPRIDADMGDLLTLPGEKDEVPLCQGGLIHGGTRGELLRRRPGDFEAVHLIDGHGQAAAIETGFGGASSPEVGNAQEAPGCPGQFLPDIGITPLIPLCQGILLGADDVEFLN